MSSIKLSCGIAFDSKLIEEIINNYKKCKCCYEIKHISDFRKRKSCNECYKKQLKKYYTPKKEKK
jgi:hypothetical protein